jgi:hypothetical protein
MWNVISNIHTKSADRKTNVLFFLFAGLCYLLFVDGTERDASAINT